MTNVTKRARAAFFLRIGQAGRAKEQKDTQTLPLWPLLLIMATDGSLTGAAQDLARKVRA